MAGCESHPEGCQCFHGTTMRQTLEEVDFIRGPWACAMSGDVNKLRDMLDKPGADVNRQDTAGYTPLHYAAKHGHLEACTLLLNRKADVNAATRAGRATGLHRAAYGGHLRVIDLLLTRGAVLNAIDSDGMTPLHKAAIEGRTAAVRQLLDAGADRTIKDNRDRLALDVAKGAETVALLLGT